MPVNNDMSAQDIDLSLLTFFFAGTLLLRSYLRESGMRSATQSFVSSMDLLMRKPTEETSSRTQSGKTISTPMVRSNYGKNDTVTLINRSASFSFGDGAEGSSKMTMSPVRRRHASKSPSSPPVSEHLALHHHPHDHQHDDSCDATDDPHEFHILTPVSSSLLLAAPLVHRIDDTQANQIIVIGVAGGSGSGKTTLAKAIYDTIGAENISLLSHDFYYKDLSHLPPNERGNQNFDHPNSLETSLLVEHVQQLKQNQAAMVPSYDYSTHTRRTEVTVVPPRPVVMVEGILIFCHPELFNLFDIRIFVDTDDDIRLIRRIQRDTIERGRDLPGIITQYVNTVRPMHMQFVEPSKRNADLIVPVGLNSVALDLVVSKLKSHLQATRGSSSSSSSSAV